ncbi:MAG TPA: Fic family protein [Candidatus Babeliaceae bacterium]|nr:Fic family protein [Candidatus Babeliaceae bacterium]
MEMKTYTPTELPLKEIDWGVIVPLLGKAYQTLAKFDAILKMVSHPEAVFFLLSVDEAKTSIYDETVKASLETILCPQVFAKDQKKVQSVLNYHKGLLYAMKAKAKKTITNDFLLELHRYVKNKEMNKAELGRFRNRQNWIGPEGSPIEQGRFIPPRASLVLTSMKNLQAYLTYPEKDHLIQLAIYFAQLLVIHPFMDGNGRIARILVPLFLASKKLISHPLFYLSAYFRKHYDAYFNHLFNISTKNAWEEWIVFFLKGIIEQGEKNCKKAENLAQLYMKWMQKLTHFLSPQEAQRSLEFLFENPVFEKRAFAAHSRLSMANQEKVLEVLKIREYRKKMVCQTILSVV